MKVTIWASGTSKQFRLHVHTAINIYKQMEMGLGVNSSNTKKAVNTAKLEAELAKMEYVQVSSSEKKKKKKGNKS